MSFAFCLAGANGVCAQSVFTGSLGHHPTIGDLGLKTEYESKKLLAEGGARTEILGSFIYPIGKIPDDRPFFQNRDSALSLIYGVSVYGSNHKLNIREVRSGEVNDLGSDALEWAGSRARMDLFVSE